MKIADVHVVGTTFRNPALLEELRTLGPAVAPILSVEPEPENPFDSNALKVTFAGEHLGYVAREQARLVQDLLRRRGLQGVVVSSLRLVGLQHATPGIYLELRTF